MMARFSVSALLLGLLSTSVSLVAASPYDQEEQNRNADCDNGCFFGSFPGGSCTNDAACMCDQQKYRERYFCCMAEKCAASVLPDSIQRQSLECEARNMPFTFDTEAVCGIKLTTSTSASSTSAASATATGNASSVTVSVSITTVTASAATTTPPATSTIASQTGGATGTPSSNGAHLNKNAFTGIALLVVGSSMLLL